MKKTSSKGHAETFEGEIEALKRRSSSHIKKGPDGKLLARKEADELYLSEGKYLPVVLDDNRISRFITEMQKAFSNGGAWIQCIESTTPVIAESLEHKDYWVEFFKSRSLRDQIPELKIPDDISFPVGIKHIGRHQFEGTLTDLLLGGGAYDKFPGTEAEARQIAKECVDGFGDLFKSPVGYSVISIEGSWTPAFNDIAWDVTFILESAQRRRWVLMWMTDTD